MLRVARATSPESFRDDCAFHIRWMQGGGLLVAAIWLWLGLSVVAQESLPLAIDNAAQFSPSTHLAESLQRRGDLVLRGTSLEAAIFTINELWKVNIVAGEVTGQVNGVFKNAPLKEILDAILLGNGYGYRLVGESIVVSPIEQLGKLNPFFTSAAIPVSNVLPSTLVDSVSLLSTPQGEVRAVDSARSLIVIDFPERVQMIRKLAISIDSASASKPGERDINGLPRPLDVGYYHTQYITAKDAQKALTTVLSPAGRSEVIEREDRLVIVDYVENLQMARRVLQQVDRPRPQVRITALIYDLTLEDIEELGVNWNHSIKERIVDGVPKSYFSGNSVLQKPTDATAIGSTFTFMNLSSNFDITATILALQQAKDSRLLANPNVIVMDNEQASFEAVTEIPYQQLTQTSNGGNLGTTAFKKAGITLDVTPKISADGTIAMEVKPEFSRLTGFSPGDNQPIIDTRRAKTMVRVANGQTVVIGGMRQRTDVGDFLGVPLAKDVRFLGHLFRSRSTDIRESELVVFITPRIVEVDETLNCREQLVVDTVHGRIDHIPVAEGGPPPGGFGGSACAEGNGGCGQDLQEIPTATPLPATPLPPMPESVGPSGGELALPSQANSRRFAGREKIAQIRRLPPVTSERIAVAPVATSPRLRPDFDSRFRASGGVYANQQRKKEQGEEIKTAKKPSFWKRMLVR